MSAFSRSNLVTPPPNIFPWGPTFLPHGHHSFLGKKPNKIYFHHPFRQWNPTGYMERFSFSSSLAVLSAELNLSTVLDRPVIENIFFFISLHSYWVHWTLLTMRTLIIEVGLHHKPSRLRSGKDLHPGPLTLAWSARWLHSLFVYGMKFPTRIFCTSSVSIWSSSLDHSLLFSSLLNSWYFWRHM